MALAVTLSPVPVSLLQVKVSEISAVLLASNAPVKVVALKLQFAGCLGHGLLGPLTIFLAWPHCHLVAESVTVSQ